MVATKITIDDIDEIPKQVLELVRKVKEGHRNCVALTKAKKVPKRLDSALPASVSAQSEKNKIKYLKINMNKL